MKVKLINKPENIIDLIYTSARTCYNAGSPIDMWNEVGNISQDKKLKLIKSVISSGHTSTLEHINFTWCIEGVSRALLAQISRHRHISLSVQSQRYVEIKESLQELRNIREHDGVAKIAGIVEKYFVPNQDGMSGLKYTELDCLIEYRRLIEEEGMAPEDARAILPNATKTNMVISMNLRELIHICNLRLCSRAQAEIRKMVKEMTLTIIDKEQWLKEYLQPSCEQLGYCPEFRGCGRKPSLQELLEINQ